MKKMKPVSIKMSDEEIAYISKQSPNRSEFIRRLIHQRKDLQGLQAIVDGLKRQREEER